MKRTVFSIFMLLMFFNISCTQNNKTQQTESLPAGSVIRDAPDNIEMVYIPSGTFSMGSNNAEDEKPPHEVNLDGYYIGKYLVTQKDWVAVMGRNPSAFKGDDLPVENVSWYDAQEFSRKLSEKTGQKYRLPTEAEWEYACRAGSTARLYFGNDDSITGEYAWYKDNSDGKTQPVGLKKPNAWGLYDMSGNVGEWCQDWWDPEYYQRSVSNNPVNDEEYLYKNPNTGEESGQKVVRSGHFMHPPKGLESAHRHCTQPVRKSEMIGFRCVREK